MITFKIERNLFDFSLAIKESVEYYNWFRKESSFFNYELVDSFEEVRKDEVPIGSLNFVQSSTFKNYGCYLKPVDITCLPTYILNRKITTDFEKTKDFGNYIFVKTKNELKDIATVIRRNMFSEIIPQNSEYIFSEVIEFASEYRIFVYQGEIVGIKHYLGDVYQIPSKGYLKDVVEAIENRSTYSFDVGVRDGKEYLIEIHDIFSLGLYGFDDYRKLPYMAKVGYYLALFNN